MKFSNKQVHMCEFTSSWLLDHQLTQKLQLLGNGLSSKLIKLSNNPFTCNPILHLEMKKNKHNTNKEKECTWSRADTYGETSNDFSKTKGLILW